MAKKPHKSSRWRIFRAELLLLLLLPLTLTHAADHADTATLDPALTAGARATAAGDSDLYLAVTLNGTESGLAHFTFSHGALSASQNTLRGLGFILPPDSPEPLRLDSLPDTTVEYSGEQQSVNITVPLRLLRLNSTVLNTPHETAQKPSASPGLLLNYDLYGTQNDNGSGSLGAFTELRAFGAGGVFSNTNITQATHAPNAQWLYKTARLDTTWSTSFPDNLLTLRIGDTFTGYQSWTRPTRIGGIQLGTDFSLQPYRINIPLPSFLGSATLPSQVDLYVNGLRQYSGKVPTGPFQLNAIPSITGAGSAQVVVTDALGRATTLDFSLYDTHRLLEVGLSQWSTELGYVRENYGLASFDYGRDPAASGNWRYGVNSHFTAELHGEATAGLSEAGGGGVLLIGNSGGLLSGSVAGSEHLGRTGSQASFGYSWANSVVSFDASETRTFGKYLDVASLYGAPPPRVSTQVVLGYNNPLLGNFGVSYLKLEYPALDSARYGSLYWFRSVRRGMTLSLNANQNLDKSGDRSLYASINVFLDNATNVSTGIQRSGGNTALTVDASRPPPSQGGWGWRAGLRQGGDLNGGLGELDYLGRYGRVDAGVAALGSDRYAYAGASGAVVWMGGDTFASHRIEDAFAVVSTDGVAGVPVSLENNPIGSTNKRGLLLVEPLNSYQDNKLSIDPMQLPADVRIGSVNALATPTQRAGTVVHFDITPVLSGIILLVDGHGKPLELGSQVRVRGQPQGDAALVGFDGETYLETLQMHTVLDVVTPHGGCHVTFDYRKVTDTIPRIGPLTCDTDGSR